MKRLFLSLILVFSMFSAFAGGLNTDSVNQAGFSALSEDQKADILKQVAQQAQANNSAPLTTAAVPTAQKVGEWVDLGTKIGQGLGGAAHEVGVAVNDFVKTPVGQWTMALIVWKLMGSVLIHVFGGVFVFITGISFIIYIQRMSVSITKTYGEPRILFGFLPWMRPVLSYQRKVPTDSSGNVDFGYVIWWAFTYAVVTLASLVTMFTY